MRYLLKLTVFSAFIITGMVHADPETIDQNSKVRTRQEGPSQFLVTCFESPQYCAEEFKRLCPNGHRVGGYFRNEYDHGQITARITCVVPQGD